MGLNIQRTILTPAAVRDITHKLRRAIEQEGIPVEQMFVIGSYAARTAHRDSDLDVALIVPATLPSHAKEKIADIPWLAKKVHIKLEPHVLTTAELRNPLLSFPAQVRKYGNVV